MLSPLIQVKLPPSSIPAGALALEVQVFVEMLYLAKLVLMVTVWPWKAKRLSPPVHTNAAPSSVPVQPTPEKERVVHELPDMLYLMKYEFSYLFPTMA
jgi:hypothetical protein